MKKIYCMLAQIILLLWFFLDMIGLYFGDKCLVSLISDIVKNLAFGCVASTIVALLIEIGNIKEQNG